jgi:hypothetical protein
MTTIVTRLYASAERAGLAAQALRKAGFDKKHVGTVTSDAADVLAAIRGEGTPGSAAAVYAERVKAGAALVVVRAPFAQSVRAQNILEDFDPIPAAVARTETYIGSAPPKPRTSARHLPILLSSDVMVLSDGIFPPAVIRNHRPMNSVMTGHSPKAGLSSGTFSEKFGMPLLIRKRESRPLSGGTMSGKLGIPTLSGKS